MKLSNEVVSVAITEWVRGFATGVSRVLFNVYGGDAEDSCKAAVRIAMREMGVSLAAAQAAGVMPEDLSRLAWAGVR